MRIVTKLKMLQEKIGRKGTYYLHTYEVKDDMGNKEDIDSLEEFKDGERVEVWFDTKYNKPKLKKKKT